jgi:hypothetical protein
MVIVDDRTAEFLAEVRRALEESRVEAGLPPTTTAAPSLEELAAAVRDSGLVGALNHVVATTISSTVSLRFLFFPVLYDIFYGILTVFYPFCYRMACGCYVPCGTVLFIDFLLCLDVSLDIFLLAINFSDVLFYFVTSYRLCHKILKWLYCAGCHRTVRTYPSCSG